MKRSHAALGVLLAFIGGAIAWILPGFGALSEPAVNDIPIAATERGTPPVAEPLQADAESADAAQIRRSLLPGWLVDLLRQGSEDEAEDDESLRHACRLQGTVVVKDKPWIKVPGMRVRLTRMWLDTVKPSQLSLPEKFFLATETVTDKHGRFVLEGVPLRHMLFLVLQRHQTIYEVHKVEEFPNAGRTRELGDVIFEPRGAIHARVVDGDGKPVPGIDVRAVDDKHNSGAARDETLHQRRVLGAARFDPKQRSRGKTYGDFVRRRDRFLPFPRTRTDAKGEFTLHGVRAAEVTLFLNGKAGYGIEDRVLVVALETTELGDLILERGEPVRLRLVHQPRLSREVEYRDLEPIPKAWVSVQPQSWTVAVPQVETDHDGYCTVRLPKGPYTIHVRCRGRRVWETPYSLGSRKGVHRYAVHPATTCRVRLTDRGDALVPDAQVVLYAYGQRHGAMARIGRLRADRRGTDGFFEFAGLPKYAPVLVVGTAPGFAPAVERGNGHGVFELRMQRGVRVRVVTIDPAGQPVPGARVTAKFLPSKLPKSLRIPGESWSLLTESQPAVLGWTNELGILDVDGLGRGRAHFAATRLTFTQTPTPEFDVRSGIQVTIRLEKSARLDGQLLLDGLLPMRPYEIHARPRKDISGERLANPMLESHRTMTGKDGTFYFNDLYHGPWVLSVAAPGGSSVRDGSRVWPEGEQDEVHVKTDTRVFHVMNLEREKGGFEIRGRVRLQGRPSRAELFVVARKLDLPGVVGRKPKSWSTEQWQRRLRQIKSLSRYRDLMKTWTNPKLSRVVARCRVSNPGGEYSLQLQVKGTYEVGLRAVQGGRVQTLVNRRVELGSKSDAKVEILDLTIASGDLELVVSREGGERVGRRILALYETGADRGAVFRIRTDADGVARLDGIPAGRYELRSERTRNGVREFPSTPRFVVDPGTLSKRYLIANW